MNGLLVLEDGAMAVESDGSIALTDCSTCCGSADCGYCRFVPCEPPLYAPGEVQCAEYPHTAEALYVHSSLLAELAARCGVEQYGPDGAANDLVILWGGSCWVGPAACVWFIGCSYFDPAETPNFVGLPIPSGSPVVRAGEASAIECVSNCRDPRCFSNLWVPAVACDGNTYELTEPVFACVRLLGACRTAIVENSIGDPVCAVFDPAAAVELPDPLPPGTRFVVLGPGDAGDCCNCLAAIGGGGTCGTQAAPTLDPACYGWSGGAVCCCAESDICCLEVFDSMTTFFHCDVFGTLHDFYDAACAPAAAGTIETTLRRRGTGVFAGSDYDIGTSFSTFCVPIAIIPDGFPGCNVSTQTPPDGAGNYDAISVSIYHSCDRFEFVGTFERYSSTQNCHAPGFPVGICPECTGSEPSVVLLRSRQVVRVLFTRRSTGPCSGGCGSTPVAAGLSDPSTRSIPSIVDLRAIIGGAGA